ncbi:NACHT domain-containing protein [Hymenobacter sp. BT523]|uniref:NACHT domain-containing protein n=1 Tax=Hymenobacter sp. BT523 TaxID=2795725 RepID=UPI0018ECEA7B|nr:NACHT domain-containing protein [Hymenobacter sp. BT523]MBJ6109903.1 NACHT domain-containing protein [Hymenobacter sp. BT523]
MDPHEFEREVLRIASHIWADAENGGSLMVDGQERDGVYITSDTVHLIECTTSRTKEKAVKDVGKLSKLTKQMQRSYPDKAVKGWFITKDELTADQRTEVTSNGYLVVGMSFNRFQARLIDASLYFSCRNDYAFGSVRDPKTGDNNYKGPFVHIDLIEKSSSGALWSFTNIVDSLGNGVKIVVQGHYGVGKSMSLREIYKVFMVNYKNNNTSKFCIYLNLRDHHGQTNPVEAIERHARNIGFSHPSHLVRAWRAGYCSIILDGFDEIAALGWADKISKLKEIRYNSVQLIREFVKNTPSSSGVLVAGRINFFDSLEECKASFSLNSEARILSIGDFSEAQIEDYLKKNKISGEIPDWVPSRPLLLGYLVAKGILSNVLQGETGFSPAEGWDFLLDEVTKRESDIEAGLIGSTIRSLIEGLASYARRFQSGLGPIYQKDLEDVFFEKCGYKPDDRALVLLQRLPGLGPLDQQDGSRYFIDNTFAEVAKAGEIARFVTDPYNTPNSYDPRNWQESLDELAIQVLANKLTGEKLGLLEEAVIVAKSNGADVLSADIISCLNYRGNIWNRNNFIASNVVIPSFDLKPCKGWNNITFKDIIFKRLYIDVDSVGDLLPSFESCIIGEVVGCFSEATLPQGIFNDCLFDKFEEKLETTSALLDLELPTAVKVGLTILKKLYLQSGGGRQENAFFRGLSPNDQRYVADVLKVLKQEEFTLESSSNSKVWLPIRSKTERVKTVLWSRSLKDPLMVRLSKI